MFTILLASLIGTSVAVLNNNMPLGTCLDFSLDAKDETDKCAVKVVVPEKRAGKNCKIQFDTYSGTAMGVEVDFWWKKGSTNFTDADKLKHTAGSQNLVAVVDCPEPGTFYLGVKEKKCDTCKLGIQARATVCATAKIDDTFVIDRPETESKQFRSTVFKIAETKWVLIDFNLPNPATPHVDIDRCATCLADGFEVWYAKQDEWGMMEKRKKMAGEATSLTFKDPIAEAGDYTIGVLLTKGAATGKSEFDLEFAINEDPEAEHPPAVCPTDDCSSADLQECEACTKENCNWCDKALTCTEKACSALGEGAGEGDDEILKEDQCPDANEACKKNEDCASCANSGRCIWCDTGSSLSGGLVKTGSCSSGKGGLRKECKSLTATGILDAKQCPGSGDSSSASSLILSLASLLIVAAALF